MPGRSLIIVAMMSVLAIAPVAAQTPPSPGELAAYTGLHAAAAQGDVGAIRKLLAERVDANARDAHGRTPLHVAAHAARRDAMAALVQGGADPRALDVQHYDAITIAAVRDDVETMKLALSLGGDPRAITSPYEGTALIAAAHLGHDEVVRTLVAAGAPLDHVNNLGWTAVIEAVVLGDGGRRHVACLKALLDAGANPNLPDRQGRTPLALARARGFGEMATLLQAVGGR